MVTESEAIDYILDCDGSCRDVTFTPTTQRGAEAFVREVLQHYHLTSAYDNNGVDRSEQLKSLQPFEHSDGYIHAVLADGNGPLRDIQLFIDFDRTTDEYCVEVTFFPNDIDRASFSLDGFSRVVDGWNKLLQADDYFVRYENASWDLYDPDGLGVIYTRKQQPMAEPE